MPPRSPRDVHRSSQGGANDARLRNGESQSSSIASGAQSAPSGRDAFGKTPSRRHSQFSDGNADRVCVALPAVDRYLPHRVEHSVEQSVLLGRTARQRADLPSFADGRSDDERIPCAVVISHQHRGAGGRQLLSPPAPRRCLHPRRSAPGSRGHVVGGALLSRRLGGGSVHLLARPEMSHLTLRWGARPSARVVDDA